MINKIFYSLVLFPEIQYYEKLSINFELISVLEIDLGLISLEFIDFFGNKEKVFFKHKNFLLEGLEVTNINNWYIYGKNKELVNFIINKLFLVDKTRDFNFYNDKIYNRKIPFGVVLTITSKCNIFCYYCFNDIDYDLKTRNSRSNYGFDYRKEIVNKLYDSGTRVVILTGGEPMVAPFFWELLDYLKFKNIFVHLNTNGTLLNDENLDRIDRNYSLNIMVSMHEFNDNDYYEVNKKGLEMTFGINKVPEKFLSMFTDKVKQLRKINSKKNISLEFLTILVWKNILNLEKIYEFGIKSGIKIHNWQFFRLYSTKNNAGASKLMMSLAINKIYSLNKNNGLNYKIVDPVPFCVTKNLDRSNSVVDGVLSDTHDVKTIITTEGYVQMMSAYDNNFWNISKDSISEIFDSEFVVKQLNNGFLPKECFDCKYKEKCRGGSRMDANIVYGNYGELDPLADLNNKQVF